MATMDEQYPDFYWLNQDSRVFLQRGYLDERETAEERIRNIAEYAEHRLGIEGFADKFYNYMQKGYYSLSSPVWSNFGKPRKGLPISCFGSFIGDSIASIIKGNGEIGMMSKHGGGTSFYMGNVRPRGSLISNGNGRSNGSFAFLPMFEASIDSINQGSQRRGMCAAYIDIDHADIEEWLNIHTEGNPIQTMYYAVCVGSDWLAEMKAGDKQKRAIWAKVLQRRSETGVPYIFFKDNVNNNKPDVYKDKNLTIHASNLCCFVGSTTIIANLSKGQGWDCYLTIENIVERLDRGEEVYALTYNETTKENEYKRILKAWKTKESKVVNVQVEEYNNEAQYGENIVEFRCTSDHLFLTKENGWVEAGKLESGEELITFNDSEVIVHNVSKESDYITAVYDLTVEDNHNFFVVSEYDYEYEEETDELDDDGDVIYETYSDSSTIGICVHNCEISLPSSEQESFVCCLSSMNLLHFDRWKDTDAVETLTYFLDAVMGEFIDIAKVIDKENNSNEFERAVRFAERHRALGLGVLGWHSYLQSKMIAFDSFQAMQENNKIFKLIQEKTLKASKEMAERYGEPELLKGYGRRHTTLMAVAPTKSSSFILGSVSPSIEPFKSNYYVKDLAKIKTTFKNPFLEKLLEEKGKNTEEIWESILLHDGSVQHLDCLTREEKDVFKTFSEVSQLSVIQQAAQRQNYIDQGQSINLMIHPDTPTKDINQLYLTAAELGVKGLYYQYSISAAQAFNRELLTCSSCEG